MDDRANLLGWVLAVWIVLTLFHKLILSPLWISALSPVPKAHWSSPISSIWILWLRYQERELVTLTDLHRRLGPILQLGPQELSISQYENGIQSAYGGVGFDKSDYYAFFDYYGQQNAFCSIHKSAHALLRRRISNVYSRTALYQSAQLATLTKYNLRDRLLPLLHQMSQSSQKVDLLQLSYSLSLDLVTGFLFGFSSGSAFLLGSDADTAEWLRHYEERYCKEGFWVQELPGLTRWLRFFGVDVFRPEFYTSKAWLEDWMMGLCDKSEGVCNSLALGQGVAPEDVPVVYKPIMHATERDSSGKSKRTRRLEIASELFDHMSGAREVLGLVLGYTLYYITQNQQAQQRLRDELAGFKSLLVYQGNGIDKFTLPPITSLDKLPYLSAVINESLRMRPNSTPLPRVTPSDRAVTLLGIPNIAPRTRINSFQWFIHRDPARWHNVDQWDPERWLDDEPVTDKENKRDEPEKKNTLWAFGSGSRACIGNNLTDYLMRYIIATIFLNYETEATDGSSFGRHSPGSMEDHLWVKFKPVQYPERRV